MQLIHDFELLKLDSVRQIIPEDAKNGIRETSSKETTSTKYDFKLKDNESLRKEIYKRVAVHNAAKEIQLRILEKKLIWNKS